MAGGGRRRLWAVTAVLALAGAGLGTLGSGKAAYGGPALLSQDNTPADISSTFGSGDYGSWEADRFGLPAYHYAIDEQQTGPGALGPQTELNGGTTAWHQVGNDYNHAFATNHGYTQLWSQARLNQWANLYQASSQHYAGGYGYLDVDGQTISTLYDDRPSNAVTSRDFGVGYFHHSVETPTAAVDEYVYAPFGTDPVLLHDVTITNRSSAPADMKWFEYWDVNPAMQPGAPGYGPRNRGLATPTVSADPKCAATHPSTDPATCAVLAVAQTPDVGDDDPRVVDTNPLSIFAADLGGAAQSYETDTKAFFGSGGRATPAEVAAGSLSDSLAPPSAGGETQPGQTLFAFDAPVSLAPGQSITLRFAYGMAHPDQITPLVDHWVGASDPLGASEASWQGWLPKASFPPTPWLGRELEWDAYMVRSRQTPEETCGNQPSLSQGGYYQYDQGYNGAFRDPLQHMLPAVYSDPALARGVILFSAQEQSQTGTIPYAMRAMCVPYYFGGEPDDLALWLMLSSAEYGLATRDTKFFTTPVAYADAGTDTLWNHLKKAYFQQEDIIGRGVHGLPNGGTTGDWADLSVETNQMTESTLTAAQLSFIYPYLAQLADLMGDSAFAGQLRTSAASMKTALAGEWTGPASPPPSGPPYSAPGPCPTSVTVSTSTCSGGAVGSWYSRGYSGTQQIGNTSIWSLAQPWAMLADVPSAAQDQALVSNIRYYLTGAGNTTSGPSRIGSALVPGSGSSGTSGGSVGKGLADAVASWFSLNGPLVWAYGHVDGAVPGADGYAWDELLRNTLANLATVHPEHWDGITSTDDVCDVAWTEPPYECGVLNSDAAFDTQILHQPAWGLFSAVKLAGIEPTSTGYDINPHVPFETFDLRLPDVGIDRSVADGDVMLRGYLTTQADDPSLQMTVHLPSGTPPDSVNAWVEGVHLKPTVSGTTASFTLPTTANHPADWAVSWSQPTASADDGPAWQSPGPPPGPPSVTGPVNCTAAAGSSCDFVGNGGYIQGYVSVLSPGTTFTIVDDSAGVTNATGSGPAVSGAPFIAGHRYTVTAGNGDGYIVAGAAF